MKRLSASFPRLEPSPRTELAPAGGPEPRVQTTCVALKIDPPYTQREIERHIADHGLFQTGSSLFDLVRFQSHLLCDFFNGRLHPEDQARAARYVLKKSAELVANLRETVDSACAGFSSLRADLDARAQSEGTGVPDKVREMARLSERLQEVAHELDRDVAKAAGGGSSGEISRQRACYLLFVNSLLRDGARVITDWTARFGQGEGTDMGVLDEYAVNAPLKGALFLQSLTDEKSEASLMFSQKPLTEGEWSVVETASAGVNYSWDLVPRLVPCFTSSGSQGITSILHAIFNDGMLLSGCVAPYAVHGGAYLGHHRDAMAHDTGHLDSMMEANAFEYKEHFRPVFDKLAHVQGPPPSEEEVLQRKQDLYVLFHVLHEDPEMFVKATPGETFLQRATSFFDRPFNVVDSVIVLNELGFDIPAVTEESTTEEQAACFQATAAAMDNLWRAFLERHGPVLEGSPLQRQLPGIFAPAST